MIEYQITSQEEGLTLLKYSLRILKAAPQGTVRKFLRKKNIELNRKKADGSEKLKYGDKVAFFLSDETFGKLSGREEAGGTGDENKEVPLMDLDRILYEDEDYLFYDKPAGLFTQSDGTGKLSLVDLLMNHAPQTQAAKPSVCNRLDVNTSGIVICGKTIKGLQVMDEAIKKRRIRKAYRLICHGGMEEKESGEYRAYLKKDKAENRARITDHPVDGSVEIVTRLRVLSSNAKASYVEAELITGKSHQIRAHLAFLGHVLYGDRKYGAGWDGCRRPMLHCYEVTLPQDILKGRTVRAELPDDLADKLESLGL
ncbi:MAG: RluA family pseudouridine synthase [Lachnospiraceae bacterium]|nr:RluA family pseudouridine synthase [Lachnospiraceae bacterium]